MAEWGAHRPQGTAIHFFVVGKRVVVLDTVMEAPGSGQQKPRHPGRSQHQLMPPENIQPQKEQTSSSQRQTERPGLSQTKQSVGTSSQQDAKQTSSNQQETEQSGSSRQHTKQANSSQQGTAQPNSSQHQQERPELFIPKQCAEMVVTCPPRSFTGLGSELLVKEINIHTLVEFMTLSSGGLLAALSGSIVWRTPGDISKLIMHARKATYADGSLVWDVLPHLVVSPGEPLAQLVKTSRQLKMLTANMQKEIRNYVAMLVADAEENRLPLGLLRHLISFLGSPPNGKITREARSRRQPARSVAVPTYQGARPRYIESAAVPSSTYQGARPRHPLVHAELEAGLAGCDERSLLPTFSYRRLDRRLADQVVQYFSRPEAAVWEGSAFSELWRRELATQLRCRNIARVTYAVHNRRRLSEQTHRRCVKQDVMRMSWTQVQEVKRHIKRCLRKPELPVRESESPASTSTSPASSSKSRTSKSKQSASSSKSRDSSSKSTTPKDPKQKAPEKKKPPKYPYPLGWRILNFFRGIPEPVRLNTNMLVFPPTHLPKSKESQQKPQHHFAPRGTPSGSRRNPVQPGEPPNGLLQVVAAQVHEVHNAQAHQPVNVREEPPAQACSSATPAEPPYGRTLEYYRYALLGRHAAVILKGRQPFQRPVRGLPPRSPLADPTPPPLPPSGTTAPIPRRRIRPGRWAQQMDSLLAPTAAEQDPSQDDAEDVAPPPVEEELLFSSRELQRALNYRWRTVFLLRHRPSESLWTRITRFLGFDEVTPMVDVEEVGEEATEASVRAILSYQSKLPPMMRCQLLLESWCL
ncbi:uncharacterized protein LOC122374334 [Amphibalanus amphitrite]|uniref:uncharacterized protein LOC122374334 n=1 Tax=Amphibalanus amphitrite TaxID=1232801 RepID=UPI001C90200B|nr:uncharacterized protein LOC122374334 [Amphibalanus amphitrite]